MAHLSLRFLGAFQAVLDGEPTVGFESDKARALLAYLAVESNRPHRRETLVGLLWPEQPEEAARANLRRVLANLRRVLKDHEPASSFFLITRQTIQFNPASDHWLDVAVMTKTLGERFLSLREVEQALTLYRGEFLDGLSIPDSIPFEEWALVQRERLHQLMVEGLGNVASRQEACGDYSAALQVARQQLTLEPWREEAHRQVMRLLALAGERAGALAQYETCCRILAKELGVEPARETTLLHQQIQAGQLTGESLAWRKIPVRGYKLQEKIGSGAFAAVYRAYQPVVEREVAIKVIHPEYANHPDFIRRFETEAQLVARLEHPQIVPLYDYWREPDRAYLVMRLLRGGNLKAALAKGPWSLERVQAFLDQLAPALALAHRQGIIHRDIKPANLLFDEEGNAYLTDFGIARVMANEHDLVRERGTSESIAYLSPEQLQDCPLSPQTDIYSMGAVLYEMLTGEVPIPNLLLPILIQNFLAVPFPFACPHRPDLPPKVDEVIQRATAKHPGERFATILEMAEAFRQAANGRTPDRVIGSEASVPALARIPNPYKGLHPFQEADAPDFFGREALVGQLLNRMEESRFLSVVGPSGSGKSSLVKAGLLPALRKGALPGSDKWFVVDFAPGVYPLDELEVGLLRVAVHPSAGLREQLERDARGLIRAARLALPDEQSQLLLVIDQFEELYTHTRNAAARKHLLHLLVEAVRDPQSPVRVLITLRADFYDRPLLHPDFSRLLQSATQVVIPLSPDELERAIRKPAQNAGVALAEGLLPVIVGDVVEQPGALPMLQYALTELFESRRENRLTLQSYRALGGVSGALAQRAEMVYEELDEPAQAAARQLFLRLVSLGESAEEGTGTPDTRRRVLLGEFRAMALDQKALEEGIAAYERSRLLLFDRDPATRTPTIEISHEALLTQWDRLKRWLEESRDELRLQRRLSAAAHEWIQAGKEASFLAHGPRLEQFETLAETTTLALTGTEQAFVQASLDNRSIRQAHERRIRKMLQFLEVGVGVAAVFAFVLAMIAFNARSSALRQSAVNQSLALAAKAQQVSESGYMDLALALAVESVQLDEPPREAVQALKAIALGPGLRAILTGHTMAVHAVAISPNALLAASGSCTETDEQGRCLAGELILWDLSARQELRRWAGHTGWVNAIAFGPDGQTLVSGAEDGRLLQWNTGTGDLVQEFVGHSGSVTSLAIAGESWTALSGSADGTLILWDLKTGDLLRRFIGQGGPVTSVSIAPGGHMAVSGGEDGALVLWNVESGEELRRFTGQVFRVNAVVLSPDGRSIISTNRDLSFRKWDTQTGELLDMETINCLPDHLALDSGGTTALVSCENIMYQWNVTDWRVQQPFLSPHAVDLNALTISLDGYLGLTASSDGALYVWDLGVQADYDVFDTGIPNLFGITASPDGQNLLLGGEAGALLWDLSEGQVVRKFEGLEGRLAPGALAISPDGRYAAAGGGLWPPEDIRSLVVWDLKTGELACRPQGHMTMLRSLAFSPDSRTLLAGSQYPEKRSGDLLLWDVQTCTLVRRFDTDEDVVGIAFNSDGSQALTGRGYEPRVILWDVATGREIRRFVAENDFDVEPILDVAWGPDETTIIGSSLRNLYLWDVETSQIIRRYTGHTDIPWSLDVSPDGRTIVSGAQNGEVILWDYATGEAISSLTLFPGSLVHVAFSLDGRSVFSTHDNRMLIRWQVAEKSLEELLDWIQANRYLRELTCEERRQFHVEPSCEP